MALITCTQLFEPFHAVLGTADHDHFLFFKLVDAVDPALLDAVEIGRAHV